MDALAHLAAGFGTALQPLNLAMAFLGVLIGTSVGMLPGIGPVNGIAVLIPVAFALDLPAATALILLAGIYYGSQYGNSISSILLNVPGTPSAVVTAIDGHQMSQQGRAGTALATSAVASFVGGTLSLLGLILFAPLLSTVAIRFGPAEYFALMVLALASLASLAAGNVARGLASTLLGLMLATVGFDPHSAIPRYTFGDIRLLDGLNFVVVTIGFFAISEVLLRFENPISTTLQDTRLISAMSRARESLTAFWTMVRGSVAGFFIGILPGAGGTVASFFAYTAEQRLSSSEARFGKGDIRGVAAPEAANNAAATGAMIPLLTLGVPGSATTAVMLGALMGWDVTPGPLMLTKHAGLFWGLVASMYIGNVILLVLNLPLVGWFARLLSLPGWFLTPAIAMTSCLAVYSINRSAFDLLLMTGFGVLGYAMRKLDYPLAPAVLGLVLGPIMEKSLRRAMALSGGSWEILFSSWLAVGIWIAAALMLFAPVLMARFRRLNRRWN